MRVKVRVHRDLSHEWRCISEAYFDQPFVVLGVGATRVNLEDDYSSLDWLTHGYQFLKAIRANIPVKCRSEGKVDVKRLGSVATMI